ncbi:MAG: TonB-dependent receptor, partial [Gammaproteobacteria bacterium]|nr:TonB-dependent receptor [Gammaproteobacteria bacterium]
MKLSKIATTRLLGASVALIMSASVYAQSRDVLEEVIVTARQQSETLQDVPVTIAALTEADLDRYNITSLVDAAKMVPNMVIAQGGSGNGSSLRLRGIGSSSISAAFDHSVALNLDGVVVNRGRFIHNSYLDMSQLEVLKGPQSLYFGKSATAGVISITTNDPGDEFELQLGGGFETEYDGT